MVTRAWRNRRAAFRGAGVADGLAHHGPRPCALALPLGFLTLCLAANLVAEFAVLIQLRD